MAAQSARRAPLSAARRTLGRHGVTGAAAVAKHLCGDAAFCVRRGVGSGRRWGRARPVEAVRYLCPHN